MKIFKFNLNITSIEAMVVLTVIIIFTAFIFSPSSKSRRENKIKNVDDDSSISEMMYKEHIYLNFSGYDNRFIVIHAEHCPCKGE